MNSGNNKLVKVVYCVMKDTDAWESTETLVIIFSTKKLAQLYISKQRDPSIYRVSQRKIYEKLF